MYFYSTVSNIAFIFTKCIIWIYTKW